MSKDWKPESGKQADKAKEKRQRRFNGFYKLSKRNLATLEEAKKIIVEEKVGNQVRSDYHSSRQSH